MLDTLKRVKDKIESYWSVIWTWVAAHPKTTVVIALAVIVATNFRR